MTLLLDQVFRRFGTVEVLRGLTLQVASGELVCLLGASGCGKTTLLRLAAGLAAPDRGRVCLEGRDLARIFPRDRPVAMVFQQPALWPHRSVAGNVGYGLEVRGFSAVERERRVLTALATVRMEGFAGRLPGELSGGEQQRVALARALAPGPRILLLDEPLSHLDPPLRRELRDEIRRLHRETGLTLLLATHDPREALSLADRVGVLRDGVLAQIGDPRTVYRRPASRAVAEAFGEIHWIEGTAVGAESGTVAVTTALGTLVVEIESGTEIPCLGWLGIRPDALRLAAEASVNAFPASVRDVSFLGAVEEWTVECAGGVRLRAQMESGALRMAVGAAVRLAIAPAAAVWVGRS